MLTLSNLFKNNYVDSELLVMSRVIGATPMQDDDYVTFAGRMKLEGS